MRLAFILGVMVVTAGFSYGQAEKAKAAEKSPQKKEQHLKIMMNQNGNEISIDTTFSMLDEKAMQYKVDSIMKNLDKSGNSKIIILKGGGAMAHGHHSSNLPGEGQFEVLFDNSDSGKVRNVRKVIRMENGGHVIMTENLEGDMMPPPPPPPPPAFRMKTFRVASDDPYTHDPDNADIVSYEKKDLGKGLEKITIIRKKQTTNEEQKTVTVKVETSDEQKK
ncbi:MAG: hypothetical protein WCP08_06115 [Prolixibacteraceae bacterium]